MPYQTIIQEKTEELWTPKISNKDGWCEQTVGIDPKVSGRLSYEKT